MGRWRETLRTPVGRLARGRVEAEQALPFWRSIPRGCLGFWRGDTWRRLRHTPLWDLARGRVSAALDWRGRIDSSDLPEPVRGLIHDLCRRTRLWRKERAAVAGELIAHFHDGLESGDTADQLIERFGDVKAAAKLIRRAKRRCRPIGWQIRHRLRQGIAVLVVVYVLAALWLATGKPEPSVDYLAKLNASVDAIPEEDRAWPILREAMIEYQTWNPEVFNAPMDVGILPKWWTDVAFDDPEAGQLAENLEAYQGYFAELRRAAQKPHMGVRRVTAAEPDPRDFLALYGPDDNTGPKRWAHVEDDPSIAALLSRSLSTVMFPALGSTRRDTRMLSADIQAAVYRGDAERALDDIDTQLGLARLTAQGPFLVEQLVALSSMGTSFYNVAAILERRPDFFDDDQLQRLAHTLAAVDVNPIDLTGERYIAYDMFQRMYDPDTGRMTRDGINFFDSLTNNPYDEEVDRRRWYREQLSTIGLPIAAAVVADYDDMVREYERLFGILDRSPRRLYPQGELPPLRRELDSRADDTLYGMRYFPLLIQLPALHAASRTELLVGSVRDALLLAIALELYRRDHGGHPDEPAELVPRYLPALPMDLTALDADGNPLSPLRVAYRDGSPVIYGLGWDGVDNGGTPPDRRVWPTPRFTETGGDWVLFPEPRSDSP
ncbi:MAG: hypothetical protein AAGK09_06225 [Planctomycetota bacterium]